MEEILEEKARPISQLTLSPLACHKCILSLHPSQLNSVQECPEKNQQGTTYLNTTVKLILRVLCYAVIANGYGALFLEPKKYSYHFLIIHWHISLLTKNTTKISEVT